MSDTKKIDWSKFPFFNESNSLCRGEEKLLTQEEVDQINESFVKMNEEIIKINRIFKRARTEFNICE